MAECGENHDNPTAAAATVPDEEAKTADVPDEEANHIAADVPAEEANHKAADVPDAQQTTHNRPLDAIWEENGDGPQPGSSKDRGGSKGKRGSKGRGGAEGGACGGGAVGGDPSSLKVPAEFLGGQDTVRYLHFLF